jgi:iron complex outermembrane receptor protein
MDYQDYQSAVTAETVFNGEKIAFSTNGNLGDAEIYGIEFDSQYSPVDGLTIGNSLGLLSAELVDVAPALTTAFTDPGSGRFVPGTGDPEGNSLPFAADVTYSGFITYEFPLPSAGGLMAMLHLDWDYRSEMNSRIEDNVATRLEERWLTNARASVGKESWQVGVFVKNLADEEYYAGSLPLFGNRLTTISMGAPRTFGLNFSYQF